MVGRFLGEVRFIFDGQILDSIEEVIKRAQQQIVIVSPYNDFPLPVRLRSALEKAAADKNIEIRVVCRKEEELKQRRYLDWFIGLGVEVYLVERLHAKIYSNEFFGIVTSMNLLESSMLNSREIGIRLTTLGEVRQYVDDLIESGERAAPAREVTRPKPSVVPKAKVTGAKTALQGSCIGCGKEIDYNTKRPRCIDCHQERDKNQDSPETYCHGCGKKRKAAFGMPISFKRPLCAPCYKEAAST